MLKSWRDIKINKDYAVLFMNNKNIAVEVIIFDLGGVLIDWSPYHLYCDKLGLDRQEVDRFMKEVDFSEWNKEQDLGRSFAKATEELTARFPEYRELIYAYDEHYLDSLKGSVQPVVDILGRLKCAGYPLYVLSNWASEKFNLVRPQYPFFEWFDGIVISGDVGLIKPDQAIFRLLLERTGCPADVCLLIDDHYPNISVARELGFQTIQFTSAQQLEAELQDMGIFECTSKQSQVDSGNTSL
jgi:2-haloacid dehalogenase